MNLSRGTSITQPDLPAESRENTTRGNSRKWIAIALIPAFLPLMFLVYLLHHYAVDVAAWDDWEMAPIIVRAHRGQPFLHDLFQQQQEARTVVPKALVLLLAAFGHWHLTYGMALSVVLSSVTVLGLYFLLRKSMVAPRATALALFFIALLLFTPVYYEVWLTGSDFSSFLPAFWLVTALVLGGTNVSVSKKFVGCAILAIAASFSLPHGLLLWGITFPLFLLRGDIRNRGRWFLLWLVPAVLCSIAYFWGYRKPGHLPLFAPPASASQYSYYIAIFLGSALVCASKTAPVIIAAVIGGSGLALFFCAFFYALSRQYDKEFRRRVLPWLGLGSYAIGSACLAAVGRVGFGSSQALQSRYGPFAAYLFVGLIGVMAVIYSEAGLKRQSPITLWSVPLFGLGLLIAYGWSAGAGIAATQAGWANNRLGRSAVLFCRAFDTGETIKKTIYPSGAIVRREAISLDELALLRPALVKTNNISSIRHFGTEDQTVTGWCESILPRGDDTLIASGWAVLNAAGRPADGVVFTYEFPERNWVLFAMSNGIATRPDIAARMNNRDQLWSGWEATFSRHAFPRGARITAWAIDSEHSAIYRLNNGFLKDHF